MQVYVNSPEVTYEKLYVSLRRKEVCEEVFYLDILNSWSKIDLYA